MFRLFFSGVAIHIRFQKAAPLHVDEARMKEIHAFTTRVYRGTFNKALVCDIEDMAYFFLPMPSKWRPPTDVGLGAPDIVQVIPWDLVSLAAQHWAVPIKRGSPEEIETDLEDAIVQDRWIEFTRRYRVVTVRRDLTPLSKPADSPREASYDNLFHFCKIKRRGLETLEDFTQPIIEVAKCHTIMNHLNPTSKPPSNNKSPAKYLIPELCAKFTLPASTLWTAMLLPSIMRRIDDLLLVKEMDAKFFDHAIREDLLHIAICTPSAGLEYDYERLELLGDAFLKYLASIYVFVTNPSLSEGALHVARQKIISNKSLLVHSTRMDYLHISSRKCSHIRHGYLQSAVYIFHPNPRRNPRLNPLNNLLLVIKRTTKRTKTLLNFKKTLAKQLSTKYGHQHRRGTCCRVFLWNWRWISYDK
ncbi:hypothetical protein BJ912DRAFT_263253 [Pholiota molesta]|nr:hypothetical protein BJ912DRAFT_263253 [Pholiota molesta]